MPDEDDLEQRAALVVEFESRRICSRTSGCRCWASSMMTTACAGSERAIGKNACSVWMSRDGSPR